MTYFEVVSILKKLEDSAMDDKLLKQIDKEYLEDSEYVRYRVIDHVINTINKRINKSFNNLLEKIVVKNIDINLFELELINFNKEISFSKKISKLSIISLENQNIFEESINGNVEEMYEVIRNKLECIDHNGEYISIFEKNKY